MSDEEILIQNQNNRQPVECWTRVMGYFRPFSQFNVGKKSEFTERQWFIEPEMSPVFFKMEKEG